MAVFTREGHWMSGGSSTLSPLPLRTWSEIVRADLAPKRIPSTELHSCAGEIGRNYRFEQNRIQRNSNKLEVPPVNSKVPPGLPVADLARRLPKTHRPVSTASASQPYGTSRRS